MLDFVQVKAVSAKRDVVEIYPEFLTRKSKDLMIKGNRFYAIWDEDAGFWSTSEYDAQRIIDNEIIKFADSYETNDKKSIKLLKNFSSRKFKEWQEYCHSLPDNYYDLDDKIIFSNIKVKKTDYVTKGLTYPIEPGNISAYEELIGTLYSKEEKEKLEWAIGSIIKGDSKKIQKFIVLFGAPGSGKSTFLNIIEMMFPLYFSVFDSKALTKNSDFALESFKENPLIAIEHDGDLSRIEDNTKLNSIVSHERLVVNEKFKNTYSSRFRSFLFMGTNKPVKITDTKSGIIRRLIDVTPTDQKVSVSRYNELMNQITFELGAIASHCLEVYNSLGISYYDNYIPVKMIEATNNFYNFIDDEYAFFAIENPNGVDLETVWKRYKAYCEDSNIQHPYEKRQFKTELANFFEKVEKNVYKGFKKDKFKVISKPKEDQNKKSWIVFKEGDSVFDKDYASYKAQYANKEEKPIKKWENVKTTLQDIDSKKLHYILPPSNLIVIDFDLKDEKGNKSFDLNFEAANFWPETYAEVSKGGNGIHLHYIYDGDVSKLAYLYDENIEIKVFQGNSSLRRKLTICNDKPIAKLNSGLPLKEEEKPMLNANMIVNEQNLRKLIKRNLKKEIHSATKPSIDFIVKILDDAYNSGMHYDVRDMQPDIQQFANNSTNHAVYCLQQVSKMHFISREEEIKDSPFGKDGPIIFFDVEVFSNLFIVCWKKEGEKSVVNKMINPTPSQIRTLFDMKLVGFNNRKYDNHILWARTMGYNNMQLYNLSQGIIEEGVLKKGFSEAYNISYTDIYDYCPKKQSLKKWEIELGIHHLELGFPWDKPVPEKDWDKVAEYCCNDVIATESVWNATQADFKAREILAELSGLTVNSTTNQCTTQIIVGDDKHPQDKFVYTDLSKTFPGYEFSPYGIDKSKYKDGIKIVKGKSLYLGEDPGEGGHVYANPGIYKDIELYDIASMHPTSAHELNIFGPYTDNFWILVQIRLAIKHGDYDFVRNAFDGRLAKFVQNEADAKNLSFALKIAINSVYGLTSSTFPNRLRDPRNVDNIVAKRGALFMINLKHEVENKGYVVVHIKTDSIKIANADDYIRNFVMEYGSKYGYTFEHEATYSKLCLINESTYMALEKDGEWTSTGDQFINPYVFKTLTKQGEITFDDLCVVDSVTTALYLDMNEDLKDGEHDYRFVGRVGQFTPILPGSGGGVLLRDSGNNDGKFSAVTGTKKKDGVYRWLESEVVRQLKLEDKIDMSYWNELADKARANIAKFGDVDEFLYGKNEDWMNPPESNEEYLPFN